MQSRRAAVIHTVVNAVAIVLSVGLAIGLTIAAADSNTGVLGTIVARLAGTFLIVLVISVVAVWIADAPPHPRAVRAAIAVVWSYLLVLSVTTLLMGAIVRQRLSNTPVMVLKESHSAAWGCRVPCCVPAEGYGLQCGACGTLSAP